MKAKKIIQIPAEYFAAVETGIKWLDLTLGRKVWLGRMKMKKFDITGGSTCVAGNVFRDAMFGGDKNGYDSFEDAIAALGGIASGKGSAARRFGFYTSTEKGMQYLQDIWVARINKMKKQARIK